VSKQELQVMPKWRQYWALTKPRVTQLAVFCAIIGMFLATPGMVPWPILIGGSIGLWLLAGAAFAVNCLVEQKVDAKMRRTAWRPSATGELSDLQIIIFALVIGGIGMALLWYFANPLMWACNCAKTPAYPGWSFGKTSNNSTIVITAQPLALAQ
jgi:protoheme IX farnesyltransferase